MLSSLHPSTNPAAVIDPLGEWASAIVTSQTEYSPGGGAQVQNRRGRGSVFARRDSSCYAVSSASRFYRGRTLKCRLADALLPIVIGGGCLRPPICFRPFTATVEHSAGPGKLSAVKWLPSSKSAGTCRVQHGGDDHASGLSMGTTLLARDPVPALLDYRQAALRSRSDQRPLRGHALRVRSACPEALRLDRFPWSSRSSSEGALADSDSTQSAKARARVARTILMGAR
jgi:hypothetical protein